MELSEQVAVEVSHSNEVKSIGRESDNSQFADPNRTDDEPIDMSLSDHERDRRNSFYSAVDRLRKAKIPVMDCTKCLLLFSDVILYRIHMTMHVPRQSWQCAMCKRFCSDRRQFLLHTVKHSHSMIPDGVVVPEDLPKISEGLPDLASLCDDDDIKQFFNRNCS